MSAFSRGFLLRPHHGLNTLRFLHILPSSKSYIQPRFFTLSSSLNAPKKKSTTSVKKNILKANPSHTLTDTKSSPVNSNYQSYAASFAQKEHPTLLYQAPSHFGFMFFSYFGAFSCFTFATYCTWANTLNPPPGLDAWIPTAFIGVSLFMAGAGGFMMHNTARIIKTITAVPRSKNQLMLEIELKKMFPLPYPARRFMVKADELQLPKHGKGDRKLNAEEARIIHEQELLERKAQLEYEQNHIMTRPIRDMSRAFHGMFEAAKKALYREGFIKVAVSPTKQVYKLDITGGWALHNGRALQRLAQQNGKL